MMLDAVYVDIAQGLVLGLKPKPEFLPLSHLSEPGTTRDAELVTGGWTRDELHQPVKLDAALRGWMAIPITSDSD